MEDFNINIKSKTIFFCLIFCLLISISAISAADINDTDQVGISQSDTISIESDNNNSATILKNSNADKLSEGEVSAGTLKDLNTLIRTSNGTLDLENDFEYNASIDTSYTNGITITKSIEIDGHGHTIKSTNNLFTVTTDNVILKNIKFTGFGSNAVVIQVSGNNFTIDNLTFHDFTAKSILLAKYCNNVKILNTTINKTTTTATDGDSGPCGSFGFIGVGGELLVDNFTSENAKHNGYSGLFYVCFDCSALDLRNSRFSGFNTVTSSWHSIIYLRRNSANLYNCNFTDISTKSYAAISTNHIQLNVNHCNFVNARATGHVADYSNLDCMFSGMMINITDSNITNCDYILSQSYSELTDVNFNGGRGFYIYEKSGSYSSKVNNVNFTGVNNPITISSSLYVDINKCNFTSCTGVAPVSILESSNRTTISNSRFIDNTGSKAGAVAIIGNINIDDYTMTHMSGNKLATGAANNFSGEVKSWQGKEFMYVSPDGSGDGSSAQSPGSLDDAINKVDARGTIYLTKGTYEWDGLKTVSQNIEGYEKEVIINEGNFALKIPHLSVKKITFNNTKTSMTYVTYTTLDNLTVNGSACTLTLSVSSAQFSEITNIIIKNSKGGRGLGLSEHNNYYNITFTDCTLNEVFYVSQITNVVVLENITVKNSAFNNFKGVATSSSGDQQFVLTLKNVTIKDNVINGQLIPKADNCVIDGFYIYNNTFSTTKDLISMSLTNSINDLVVKDVGSGSSIISFTSGSPITNSQFENITTKLFKNNYIFNLNNVNFTSISKTTGLNCLADSVLADVNFNNCTFNDYSLKLGNHGSLSDSSFDNVTGSVFLDGENVVLNNVHFTDCSNALTGCVVVNGELCFIEDSEFLNNNATGTGGAITIKANGTNIINTDFNNNRIINNESGHGGAIFVIPKVYYNIDDYSKGKVNSTSMHPRFNDLYDEGCIPSLSVIYVNYGYTQQEMVDNSSKMNDLKMALGAIKATGTIIFTNASDVVFNISAGNTFAKQGVTIKGNNSRVNVEGYITVSKYAYSLTISNVTFSGAPDHVFKWIGDDGKLINCTFKDNGGDESNYGSCIDVEGNNMQIIKSTFKNNQVRSNNAVGGGALYVNASGLKISNSTFEDNQADHGAHILLTDESEIINIFNSTFTRGSKATEAGPGSSVEINSNYNVVINASKFTDNSALSGGALLIQSSGLGDITIKNTTFQSNHATSGDGGAIKLVKGSTTIDNCTFQENTASGSGGAVYNSVSGLKVKDSNFTSNTADHDGGALYSSVGQVDISSSNFTSNGAGNGNGGAVYLSGAGNKLSDLKFTENNAVNGSAVYLKDNGAVEFRNVLVKDNAHTGDDDVLAGGDVYIGDDASFTIPDNDLTLDTDPKQTIRLGRFTSPVIYVSNIPGEFGTGTINDPMDSIDSALMHIADNGRIILLTDTYDLKKIVEISGKTFTLVGNASTVKRDENNNDKYLFNLPSTKKNYNMVITDADASKFTHFTHKC